MQKRRTPSRKDIARLHASNPYSFDPSVKVPTSGKPTAREIATRYLEEQRQKEASK